MFSDLQCPYCAKFAEMIRTEVLPNERKTVRIVYRHFPLSGHDWARRAAEACACAHKQGDRHFWAMHDFVLSVQDSLTTQNLQQRLLAYSERLSGFDRTRFQQCYYQRHTASIVDRDINFGQDIGVNGTPTVFINGRRTQVGADAMQLRTIIRELRDPSSATAGKVDIRSDGAANE